MDPIDILLVAHVFVTLATTMMVRQPLARVVMLDAKLAQHTQLARTVTQRSIDI